MLKVVIFDGGYGGELFADRLKEVLPVVEIIRVIDWRNAEKLLYNSRTARRVAKEALLPYIGRVDLIILANHLLTITSLKYFRRKFKEQKFLGFDLKQPTCKKGRSLLILTTSAVTKTINYYNYLFRVRREIKTLVLDDWPAKIDDGELDYAEIHGTMKSFLAKEKFLPDEIMLASAQFSDVKRELRRALGWNIKTYDSFDDCIRNTCKCLNLRGGNGRKTD